MIDSTDNVTIIPSEPRYVREVSALAALVYPGVTGWPIEQLNEHLHIFPAGQLIAIDRDTAQIVGASLNLVVRCEDVVLGSLYMDIIDSGWFRTHDTRNGHVMYAADLFVHPAARQRGVGSALLAFRWETSMRLCVNRIVGSARLERMPPPSTPHEKYLQMLRTGGVDEPGLRFLLSRGATLLDLLPHHFDASQERCPHAVLTGWDGPPRAQPRSRNGPGTAPQEIHR